MMSAVTGVMGYIYPRDVRAPASNAGVAAPTSNDVLPRTAGARRAVACSIPLRTEPDTRDRDKRGRGDPAVYRTRTAPRAAPGTGRRTSVVVRSPRAPGTRATIS